MYQLTSITKDPYQKIVLILPGSVGKATLYLQYLTQLQSWYMTLDYLNYSIDNRRVYSSPNLLRQWDKVFPFGIGCYTKDNTDPYLIDDFQNGRCGLVMLSQAEIENYEAYLTDQKNAIT